MELQSPQIPTSFFIIIGVLVVFNFANIIAFMVGIFKAGSFVEATRLGIKEALDCGARAHKRIDKLEDKIL